MIDIKYGGIHVKKFGIGFSLGGLLLSKISAARPSFFSSVALLAPYFGFLHKSKFGKFNSVIESLNETNPTKKMMLFPMKPLPPDYTLHFVTDPVCETRDICVRNLWELSKAPTTLTDQMIF